MGKLFDWSLLLNSLLAIIRYVPITLFITLASMLTGLLIALLVAFIKLYKIPVLNQISVFYVSFIRGTPLLVQLYLIYYGIPRILNYLKYTYSVFSNYNPAAIAPIHYAMFAFSINIGAYLSETMRSSLEAVDRGQYEGALSIGLNRFQIMSKIVLPQAFVIAMPNIGNHLISNLKGTSLVFMISIIDIMGEAKIIGARENSFFEVYVAAAIIYWILCILFEILVHFISQKINQFQKGDVVR